MRGIITVLTGALRIIIPLATNTAKVKKPYSAKDKMPERISLSVCVTKTHTDEVKAMVNANFSTGLTGCILQPIISLLASTGLSLLLIRYNPSTSTMATAS